MNEEDEIKTIAFPSHPLSATEAVEGLLRYAAHLGASDIHVDPQDHSTQVRFRVDGVLESGWSIPGVFHEEAIARLKILCGARTDLHAVPQDGRFRIELLGHAYNIRVSFMPTYHGENAVARLLPSGRAVKDSFATLGFTPEHASVLGRSLSASNGLILVTGPTGSGKTTTLCVCLGLKASEPLSVMTLEDPVEYEVPGVRHVHIRHGHGVTFASALRAALRQDPDVIMVGEIRDNETARTAIHTALTGHLVLTTLHTTSALDAIVRLLDMGVERYLLASTLRLIVSQRLVRTICRKCIGSGIDCQACRGSGMAGCSVIAEVLEIDPELREMIGRGDPVSALREHAASHGFCQMDEDAEEKVLWGVTTKSEIAAALYV
jgi:general secretion pathway protein E